MVSLRLERGSSALVLVDGFERDMNELNYEDIRSYRIERCFGNGCYGSRELLMNVVLITTRRGESIK